jgi:hypothetical protein
MISNSLNFWFYAKKGQLFVAKTFLKKILPHTFKYAKQFCIINHISKMKSLQPKKLVKDFKNRSKEDII